MMYIESKNFGDTFKNKKEFEKTDKNFYINRGENFKIHPSSDRFIIDFQFYRYLEPDIMVIGKDKIPSYILDWLKNTGLEIFYKD